MKNKTILFKHKVSGEYLRLIKSRKSGLNTYLQVDQNNNPISIKRIWSASEQEQKRLVNGFSNLIEINSK